VAADTIDEALRDAAVHGFTSKRLEDWSAAVDAEMAARLAAIDLKSLPIRKRIRTAVLTRLEILAPRKDIARKAALFLARPDNAPLALSLLARTADRMWQAAGDTATDFNWYTKRAILGGVYAATEIAWFGDDTPDGARTGAFLDARLENVMQFEKLKARLRACTPAADVQSPNGQNPNPQSQTS
jgi:ubiquinone biosynthesis protein COQ9